MNAFQKTAIGRLAMMFRKWLPSAMTRRFQGENYSLELEDNKEGYYNTTGKFL